MLYAAISPAAKYEPECLIAGLVTSSELSADLKLYSECGSQVRHSLSCSLLCHVWQILVPVCLLPSTPFSAESAVGQSRQLTQKCQMSEWLLFLQTIFTTPCPVGDSALSEKEHLEALERRWSRPAMLRSCRDRSGMGHQPASAQGLEHEYCE